MERSTELPLPGSEPAHRWTFLTNHAHVLLCIDADRDVRVRGLAARIGITERAVQRILADLEAGGFLERERIGRRTRYRTILDRPMRHPVEASRDVRVIVDALDLGVDAG